MHIAVDVGGTFTDLVPHDATGQIHGYIERADAETKLAALELIMGTSQNVVAMARKLTMPKVKTRTVIARTHKTQTAVT